MPNMASITIKKADGTTDVIYVNQSPASGDATPARWRIEAIGTVPGNRPTLTVFSKATANGAARVISGKLVYPETYTDSTTGLVAVRNTASASFTAIIPQNLTDTTIAETAAQFANILKATLVQDSIKSGFAPS